MHPTCLTTHQWKYYKLDNNECRMPRNRLSRAMKLFSNWQMKSWQTFEETSGYVRPERVNKRPNNMTYMMMMMMTSQGIVSSSKCYI